jgi:hypothetical protein
MQAPTKISKKKLWTMRAAVLLIIAVVISIVGFVSYRHMRPGTPNAVAHTWTSYVSPALGIMFDYPSDVIAPVPENESATSSLAFTLPDATDQLTPNSSRISIFTVPTSEPTAAAYIAKYYQMAQGLASSTVVAGIPAVVTYETAYTYMTLYVVHDGRFYTFSIDLPPAEAVQMKDSIQFTDASAAAVPSGWYAHSIDYPEASPALLKHIILTKDKTLPVRNAGDGAYSDDEIDIAILANSLSPEAYIVQEGLAGDNAKVLGLPHGAWSTFDGHQMFSIDLEIGESITLFGTGNVESFVLNNPADNADFWHVIASYAQDPSFGKTGIE